MSAAANAPDAAPKKGSKKLLIIGLAAVLVLSILGGGAAVFLMKKKAAAAEAAEAESEDGESKAAAPKKAAAKKADPAVPPTFVPLEPFVVNLADRDIERYAQIGVTLKVDDPKFAEQMKAFMPAIRSNILMVIAHKTSSDLLGREGKEALAEEIAREAVRPMGIDIDPPTADTEDKPAKKRKAAEVENPIRQVLFSSFIVQ